LVFRKATTIFLKSDQHFHKSVQLMVEVLYAFAQQEIKNALSPYPQSKKGMTRANGSYENLAEVRNAFSQ
jgi:hypothetical protein